MMEKPVFLVGFMGSGKTTWGKKIANSLGVPFIDLDQEIVKNIGISIPEYFQVHGEEKFRKLENEFLKKQLGQKAIISTGGGTPCYYDNMEWINQHGLSIYLYHTAKSLWSRLSQSDVNKRPLLKGLSSEELYKFIVHKLNEREPFYNQAHIKCEQIHTSLDELITMINTTKTNYE